MAMSVQVTCLPEKTASPQVPMDISSIGASLSAAANEGIMEGAMERGNFLRVASVSSTQARERGFSRVTALQRWDRHSSKGRPLAMVSSRSLVLVAAMGVLAACSHGDEDEQKAEAPGVLDIVGNIRVDTADGRNGFRTGLGTDGHVVAGVAINLAAAQTIGSQGLPVVLIAPGGTLANFSTGPIFFSAL